MSTSRLPTSPRVLSLAGGLVREDLTVATSAPPWGSRQTQVGLEAPGTQEARGGEADVSRDLQWAKQGRFSTPRPSRWSLGSEPMDTGDCCDRGRDRWRVGARSGSGEPGLDGLSDNLGRCAVLTFGAFGELAACLLVEADLKHR